SKGLKEDRVSQLPDPLLTQILNLLTTEEAVKTSVLSTRWRTLWLWVPNLELSFSKFPSFTAFLSFGNLFFDSVRVSCIDNLKLYIDGNDASYLKPWIDALVKRKIQRLYVRRTLGGYSHEMPLSLYVCESLVSLKLFRLTLVDVEFVSLPCLKILRLKDIVFHNEATFERLVSSCPVLEELKIDVVWNDGNVYRVHSRSLKRFCFRRSSSLRFQLIHHYSEFEQLPRFGYMSSLYVTLNASDLKLFPIFLRSCPNLKSLILERIGCSHQLSPKAKERGSISSVPECLLTSLEFVEFKAPIWGLAPEMKLVWYFLENCPTLKKLTLRLKSHLTKDDFVKQLLKIPRGSTDCEIVIL
ncbi:F-box-like domain superfamily, partial [Arabidopsis suecica]